MLHERAVALDISHKIRSRATQVIEAEGRGKGGPHGHVSVFRGVGDFGIPNLHRFRRRDWPMALDRISWRGQFAIGV